MPKKSPPLDDLRRLDDHLEEGRFLVIEDNLRLKVNKKGKKIFEARYRKNGLDRSQQVGTHPETPIEEVRANMRSFLSLVEAERANTNSGENAPTSRRKRLSKPDEKESASRFCLQTEAHCWQFLRKLFFTFSGIPSEHRLAILLLLALPARPKDLLTAKWSDIEGIKLVHGKGRLHKISPRERSFGLAAPKRFSWISPTCQGLLKDLRSFTGTKEHLFPSLVEMSPQERSTKLNSILEDVWTRYPVRISGLQFTFAKLAKEYSEFKPEFIDALVMKEYKIAAPHRVFYDFQVRSVLTWWGRNLERLLDMENFISKHDIRSMEFDFWLHRPNPLLI